MTTESTLKRYIQREKRTRSKVRGTLDRPRLSVFRSHAHIEAQIIDDDARTTLVSASDHEVTKEGLKKSEKAMEVGRIIADKAKEKGIIKVVFDRGGNAYHGRVKALADGAREKGLDF